MKRILLNRKRFKLKIISASQTKGSRLTKSKLQNKLRLFTFLGIFCTYRSQTSEKKGNKQFFFIRFSNNLKSKMQVELNEIANSYEVVPVSLSDPFKSLVAEPSTMEVLKFLPIIAFFALIIAAIWRQGKKFPIKALGNLGKDNKQD